MLFQMKPTVSCSTTISVPNLIDFVITDDVVMI